LAVVVVGCGELEVGAKLGAAEGGTVAGAGAMVPGGVDDILAGAESLDGFGTRTSVPAVEVATDRDPTTTQVMRTMTFTAVRRRSAP